MASALFFALPRPAIFLKMSIAGSSYLDEDYFFTLIRVMNQFMSIAEMVIRNASTG
jgi:hypothetical protein